MIFLHETLVPDSRSFCLSFDLSDLNMDLSGSLKCTQIESTQNKESFLLLGNFKRQFLREEGGSRVVQTWKSLPSINVTPPLENSFKLERMMKSLKDLTA